MSLVPSTVASSGVLPGDYYFALQTDIPAQQVLSQSGNTISLSGGGGAVNVASTTAVATSTQKLTETTYDAGLGKTRTAGQTVVFEPALEVRIEPKLEVQSTLVVQAVGGKVTQIDGFNGIYTTGDLKMLGTNPSVDFYNSSDVMKASLDYTELNDKITLTGTNITAETDALARVIMDAGLGVEVRTDAQPIKIQRYDASGLVLNTGIRLNAADIRLTSPSFILDTLPSATQTSIVGYDTVTKALSYQPLPTAPLTGFTATGGDSITTFYQGGVEWKAHIFSTVGSSNFIVTSFGTSTNPTIDILLVGGGGSGGRGDGTNIYGGGGGAGAVVLIDELPLINNATLPQSIQTVIGSGGAARTTSGTGNTGNPTYIIIPDVLNGTYTNLTIDTGSAAGGGGGTTAPTTSGQSTYFWNTQNGLSVPSTIKYSGAAGGTASGTGASVTRQNAWFLSSGVGAGRCGETITAGGMGGGLGNTGAGLAGAGGGGARGVGGDASSQARNAGGFGLTTYIDGTRRMVGGGGMGAGQQSGSAPGINIGVNFGGGVGQWTGGAVAASAGVANTGGGGGGSFNGDSGAGGSGLLIIRYRS